MNPLGVFRFFYGFGGALCVVSLALPVWQHADRKFVAGLTAIILVVAACLFRCHRVGIPTGHGLCCAGVLIMSGLVWGANGTDLAYCYATFFVWVGIFAGLFFSLRAVLAYQGAGGLALWFALSAPLGLGRAVMVAALMGVALTTASIATAVLTEDIRRRAGIDMDTELLNGRGLAGRFDARRTGPGPTVFVLAVDGLGDARESFGHEAALTAFRQVIEAVKGSLPMNAILGRISGDDLVAILPDVEDDGDHGPGPEPSDRAGSGGAIVETAVRAVDAGRYLVEGLDVRLTARAGAAIVPSDGESIASVVKRATSAAHFQELTGPSPRSERPDTAMTRVDYEVLDALDGAVEGKELWLAYQPQVAAGSMRPVATEALLRWRSSRYGPLSPDSFIPLAERSGLISSLTRWVLNEALDAQVRWRQAGFEIPVAVNVSGCSLNEPDLPEAIVAALKSRRLPAACLTIEITETVAMADPLRAREWLWPLADAGIRVSIDDFGAGYTSLAALPDLPLSELKVDQRFVIRSATSVPDEAIVRTVGELAHRLGFDVVAEGVEDEATGRRLSDFGFDVLQGYHFARPMAEDDLLAYLTRHLPAVSPFQRS